MLIDTHIHLQDSRYTNDVDEVLQRAATAGVGAVIVPGTNLADSQQAVVLAERYAKSPCQVYAAVGLHPTEAHHLNSSTIDALNILAQHERVVAIGEIGLDYYWPAIENRTWDCAEPSTQRRAFEIQLSMASERNLPVIVHDRDAHTDTLEILSTWHTLSPTNRGVLHSYSMGVDMLNNVFDLGFFISISGPVTFKNAHELRRVAEIVHDNILLVETDGPYLTPEPHRGVRNEPQYVSLVAKKIAELRSISQTCFENLTTGNARSLFHFNELFH